MNIDRISYQKVFPIAQYVNERIGLEASLDIGENPGERLSQLKQMVEQIHRDNNPGLYVENTVTGEISAPSIVRESSTKNAKELLIQKINDCHTIAELETFKLLASSNPELNQAYNDKYSSFTKKINQ